MKTYLMVSFIWLVAFMNSCDQGVQPEPICSSVAPDSTSHAFAWTITELGEGGGSILRDVAIINDTMIYAVGEIHLRDSTGQFDPKRYNLAQWDGKSWQASRVQFPQYNIDCTVADYAEAPINSVFAFSSSIILFTDDLSVARSDGSGIMHYPCVSLAVIGNGRITKLWGKSENDFYCVGTEGTIFHYNGIWQKLSSGTTLPIRDIWGSTDPLTGEQTILAIASGSSPEEGRKLLSINGTTVTHLPVEGLSWIANGTWFEPNCQYYVVGAGVHQKSKLKDPAWNVYPPGEVTSYESGGVRGSALNNVFVVGSFMEVVHFNGSSWYNYRNEIPFTSGALGGMAVTDNLVVAVGLNGQKAIAVIGRR